MKTQILTVDRLFLLPTAFAPIKFMRPRLETISEHEKKIIYFYQLTVLYWLWKFVFSWHLPFKNYFYIILIPDTI